MQKMVKVESSKKKCKPASKDNAVVQEKLSLKPKKMLSEIDEIFSGKKRKRVEEEGKPNTSKGTKVVTPGTKSHNKKKMGSSEKSKASEGSPHAHSTSRPKKKTADGMTIYTEEELGIGKSDAGGTRLCPFDCDCCF